MKKSSTTKAASTTTKIPLLKVQYMHITVKIIEAETEHAQLELRNKSLRTISSKKLANIVQNTIAPLTKQIQ